jgi:heat shock protein HtpX
MVMFKRVGLFVLTNIGLIVSISALIYVIERFFGVSITPSLANGYGSLALYSAIFGFTSAFLSLAISRMMAKWTHSIRLISSSRLIDESSKIQLVYATVDRLARKHGITMPEVGVYESTEPNAFATGPTRNRALIAVSQGLLDTMDAAEIEWVIGHEMAHVLNGDMVTMTLLQGVLNAIVIFVSRILANMIGSALSRGEETSPWMIGLISIVLEIAFGFAAMIVLMAFSRHREYQADADSARMVGKMQMVAALKRLGTLHDTLAGKVESNKTTATMSISSYNLSSWFSSHPPLADRVRALEGRVI